MQECSFKKILVECKNCRIFSIEEKLMCLGNKSMRMSNEMLKISCGSFEELIKLREASIK